MTLAGAGAYPLEAGSGNPPHPLLLWCLWVTTTTKKKKLDARGERGKSQTDCDFNCFVKYLLLLCQNLLYSTEITITLTTTLVFRQSFFLLLLQKCALF